MRAKLINEKFSEQSDPIADLGVGGVMLNDLFYERKKLLEKHIQKVTQKYDVDWHLYLQKILVGKTITGKMELMAAWTEDMSKKVRNAEYGKFTIKVKQISVEDLSKEWGNNCIIIADDQNILYKLNMSNKIYISDES